MVSFSARRMALAISTLAIVLLGVAQPTDAAVAKNYSIFLMQPGKETFGTLENGVFTKKKSVTTNVDWDSAAVSRTSMLLYNKTTGGTQTGTFTNGVYTKKHTYSLTAGFDMAAASCDSVMLYRQSDGKTTTATLTGGALGTRHSATLDTSLPLQYLASTCDTYIGGYQVSDTDIQLYSGSLTNGRATPNTSLRMGNQRISLLGTTATSFLIYDDSGREGTVGTAKAGQTTVTDRIDGFSGWDKLAGSGDTLLFYVFDAGVTSEPTLKKGVYAGGGAGPTIATGWKLIAGGK